ncbi:MAG: divergent PAP2 family protein [Treponema sp.]|nr:divergent PAP2 family protein [Treponema sp.]
MFANARNQFNLLITNYIFLSCVFSWFCAQFIKTVIRLFYGRVHSLRELLEIMVWRTGGMPSSHSAFVTSLSTAIAFHSGIDSDIFILSFAFTFVTIRDALGVRRANGIQAKRINEITKIMNEKQDANFKSLKEVNGHSPMEVFVGCLLGFFIGVAFSVL